MGVENLKYLLTPVLTKQGEVKEVDQAGFVEVGIGANGKPLARKCLEVVQINAAACIEIAPVFGVYPVNECAILWRLVDRLVLVFEHAP